MIWNPWSFKCPLCSALLEANVVMKSVIIGSIPMGLLFAAIAIYQEEKGRWVTADSLTFFFWLFIVSFIFGSLIWPFVSFKVKK